VDAEGFDEGEFFAALARSGARLLLIGRRALIALGLPMGRESIEYSGSIRVTIPSLDDLITTKRWAMRDKDRVDIRFFEGLKQQRKG
jgi:hypothetical protein